MVAASREFEVHAEDILSQMGDAVFLVGNDDRVVYVNRALTNLTGIAREEVIGKPYNFFLSQVTTRAVNPRQALKDVLAALDRINHSPSLDLTLSRPTPRHLELGLFQLGGQAGHPAWGGRLHDLTSEHKRIAQKTKVLLALSDEMRSSLVSIVGWATTVLDDRQHWNPEELYDFLRAINANAESSIHLLENVRDVSRLQLSELELDCKPTDLKRLIQAVGRRLADQTPDLNLVLDIPDNLPMVEVDIIRLSRGLQNLLYCVLKLAFGCRLRLSVRQEDSKARLDISYQGISLSNRLHGDDLDEPLPDGTQESQMIREVELRLFIARGILALHDGQLWTEDAPEQGTLLHIVLPLKRRPSGKQSTSGESEAAPSSGKTSKPNAKVLVAESDDRVLRLLRVQLEMEGYRVITTNDGRTALELAAIEVPDIILLDLYLPGTDGFGICQRLREFTSAPILVMAADTDEKVVIRCLNMGADDYVTKPLRTKELFARVQANLRRSCLAEIPDKSNGKAIFKVRDLEIDFVQRQVTVRGALVDLTPIEYKLLHYLAANAGRILTHGQLVSKIWGPMFKQETQYLWVNIRRLRGKIEVDPSNPEYILTERGVGYYLTCPDTDNGLV